jgi:hypothetical protein
MHQRRAKEAAAAARNVPWSGEGGLHRVGIGAHGLFNHFVTRYILTRVWTISALSRTGVCLSTSILRQTCPSGQCTPRETDIFLDAAIANPLSDAFSHMGMSIISALDCHDLTLAGVLWRTDMD